MPVGCVVSNGEFLIYSNERRRKRVDGHDVEAVFRLCLLHYCISIVDQLQDIDKKKILVAVKPRVCGELTVLFNGNIISSASI